jgi:hypothetical protein
VFACPEAEPAAGLLYPVLCAREHPSEQVWYRFVTHSDPVVLLMSAVATPPDGRRMMVRDGAK